MKKYKLSALFGTIIMGISSFAACVSNTQGIMLLGNIGLIISICIMSYGFYHWQP